MSFLIVRQTIKNGRKMFGAFALTNIARNTNLGRYSGVYRKRRQNNSAVSSYDMIDVRRPEYVFSPTNEHGEILERFRGKPLLYVNEPSERGETSNVMILAGRRAGEYPSFITTKKIKRGQEILVRYGALYKRDYSVI